MFVHAVAPPLDFGMTWSKVKSDMRKSPLCGDFPQYWHVCLSLKYTFVLLNEMRWRVGTHFFSMITEGTLNA